VEAQPARLSCVEVIVISEQLDEARKRPTLAPNQSALHAQLCCGFVPNRQGQLRWAAIDMRLSETVSRSGSHFVGRSGHFLGEGCFVRRERPIVIILLPSVACNSHIEQHCPPSSYSNHTQNAVVHSGVSGQTIIVDDHYHPCSHDPFYRLYHDRHTDLSRLDLACH